MEQKKETNPRFEKVEVIVGLQDVVRSGSVRQAIRDQRSDSILCDSGRQTEISEFGRAYFDDLPRYVKDSLSGFGAWEFFLDSSDGRVAINAHHNADGERDCDCGDIEECREKADITWSEHSRVQLVCPEYWEALSNPREFAEMVKSAVTTHNALSCQEEWRSMVDSFLAVSDALENEEIRQDS